MLKPPRLILASASTARLHLLRQIGLEPLVCPSGVDEAQIHDPNPQSLVATLATAKATQVAQQFSPPGVVLGCDSLFELGGVVYGKPADAPTALAQLQQLSGKQGQLHTGHTLIDLTSGETLSRVATTQVFFARLTSAQMQAYVHTSEPLQCAGAFALEGKGGIWVERLTGCPSNVIGLSLPLLREMMQQLGYDLTQYW
ncbi:Maf-like protein [Gloeomargarita lithophora Alchichica-D10]|uniref:Nucleoside triphosphate pyrophosphatase n=1 Tax=Gloeomargarita lithophora Alchichica-D10 TaxID=1188229 RepID=A0A1J0AGI1_9CYAN|nr:Maf family protein [Gloeomargarita lithophora]APB35058.1 Maf-like protein [Gloeomargarita lithophora Alchichica-D10]